jgi:hypothetical protein
MNVSKVRLSMLLLLLALITATMAHAPPNGKSTDTARAEDQAQAAIKRLAPAANLRVHVSRSQADIKSLLEPKATAWNEATPTQILLNRTPRVYQTEPPFEGRIPALEVRVLRAESKFVARLEWEDETMNAPEAPPRLTGEAGDPEKLYTRPTAATSLFADAVAIMVPENWTGPEFPSLQMGDAKNPVHLYYWNASRGAEDMTASGRTTTKSAGRPVAHQAEHSGDKWHVTLELPEQPDGTPIAFAVWNGASNDRDGLKFFSIWYVLVVK